MKVELSWWFYDQTSQILALGLRPGRRDLRQPFMESSRPKKEEKSSLAKTQGRKEKLLILFFAPWREKLVYAFGGLGVTFMFFSSQ